jgi:hypothetical protein
MTNLNPNKLFVTNSLGSGGTEDFLPRWYTLTHSDRTGDLFLTIDREADENQIAGLYTRLMRDEVVAEWKEGSEGDLELHVYVHVSGGFVFGTAGMRDSILRRHMPMVLEAFSYAESDAINRDPALKRAIVRVHYQSHRKKFNRIEDYGHFGD